MLLAVLRRIGVAVLTLLGASALIWSLLLIAPGDPARGVLTARGIQEPDDAAIAGMRAELGLDGDPLTRYLRWLWSALQGDLGTSWKTGESVVAEFATRLPATLLLTGVGLLIGIALAMAIGVISAAFPNRWPDKLCRVISLAMIIVPGFLVGLFVLNVLVLNFGLGRIVSDGTLRTVGWPAFTLALGAAGSWSRILRAALLEAQSSAYLDVARARGAGRTRQLLVHAMPNAIGPFLTIVGLGAASLIGGSPITETVFTWPGVGKYTVQAIEGRDQPVIAAFTMIAVLVYVAASLLIDLLLALIDPRLRDAGFSRRKAKKRYAAPFSSDKPDARDKGEVAIDGRERSEEVAGAR